MKISLTMRLPQDRDHMTFSFVCATEQFEQSLQASLKFTLNLNYSRNQMTLTLTWSLCGPYAPASMSDTFLYSVNGLCKTFAIT